MSEQILRNPKSSSNNGSGYNISNKTERQNTNNSAMTLLTKVKSPLANKFSTTNQQKRFQIVDKNLSRQVDNNYINNRNSQQQFQAKNQSLQQPQYRFNADRFNLSSDDSFMFDQSMRESRKQKLEKQIVQRFKNSRRQIQELLRRSRQQRREQMHQQEQQISHKQKNQQRGDQTIIQNSLIMIDKKQAKRKKLKYYHCDSIIIKPQLHPTKVYQLAITPTTLCINNNNNNDKNNHHHHKNNNNNIISIQADQSFSSSHNSKYYQSANKPTTTNHHKFLDSFNQSPLDKLNSSKHYYKDDDDGIDSLSPSFVEQRKQRASSNYEEMSFFKDKSMQKRKQIFLQQQKNHNPSLLNKNNNNYYHHQSALNDKKRSRTMSQHQAKHNNFDNNSSSQQTTPTTHSFKRRNKIFANDKKSGLKLSRAIRYQEQINKLKGQMGVDVFHIVIQQEEFLRQCCT